MIFRALAVLNRKKSKIFSFFIRDLGLLNLLGDTFRAPDVGVKSPRIFYLCRTSGRV